MAYEVTIFSLFLVLTLILTALAGCGSNAADSSEKDDDYEQLLEKGYYEVYDEDDDLVCYLRVTSSKLIVYDEYGDEEDSLRYDYNGKKELYTLDDGELFGCEEFTVEKKRRTLTLITEDDDEYTLEEIDKSELPSGGQAADSGPANETQKQDEAESGYIELPLGCYAVYDGSSVAWYLKVEAITMISYYSDGDIQGEFRYRYDRDGSCVLEYNNIITHTIQFTYEQGSYYMSFEGESVRLDPISESEIPVYYDTPPETRPRGDSPATAAPSGETYYIGDNGSIILYAWMPEELYEDMDFDYDDGGFEAEAEYYDYYADTDLFFYVVLASDDFLQEGIDEARRGYNGTYRSDADLLYDYFRDMFILSLASGYFDGEYLGDDLDYQVDEDNITINAQDWRYCAIEIYEGDTEGYLLMCFWMEGDDMALVAIGGTAEDSDSADDIVDVILEIMLSLDLDT